MKRRRRRKLSDSEAAHQFAPILKRLTMTPLEITRSQFRPALEAQRPSGALHDELCREQQAQLIP